MRISRVAGIVIVALFSGPAAEAQTTAAQTQLQRTEFAQWMKHRQAVAADPDVVAYYDFQDREGTTLKNRSKTGAALDGKIVAAEWVAGRWPGKSALRFDGEKSVVEIPSAEALSALNAGQVSGEMTIELWMNAASKLEGGLIDKSSAGTATDAPWCLWISPNRLVAYVAGQSGSPLAVVGDSQDIITGDWVHVVAVIDAKTLSLYRDGVLLGRAPRADKVADNGKPLLLGSMGLPGRYFFDGLLDEVVIYQKALSEETIKAHAELFPSPSGPPSITLTSPGKGDRWNAGTQHSITWTSENVRKGTPLTIELSTDDGNSWQVISAAVPNIDRFVWDVPVTVSEKCQLRIQVNSLETKTQTVGTFAVAPAPEIPHYEWQKVALPAAFAPRDGAGALVYKDRMWLLGGWNPPNREFFPRACNNEVWSSRDGADWTLVKPNSFKDSSFDPELDWEGRHTAGYVVYRDKMWIIGGDANQGYHQFDVWNSTDGKSWNFVNRGKPVPWGPRVLHYTLVHDDRIWVIGGQSMPGFTTAEEAFYRDVWTTTDGINWTEVKPEEPFWPQRGMIGGNVVFKGRMWILGGGTYDTPQTPQRKYFNDVWSSADGVKWQSHTQSAPWAPRQYHEVAVFDDRMWVMEGYARGNRNDVWHSADGVNWYELPATPWKPRHAASVFVHDNALWMVAGNNMESDVWKLVKTEKKP